MKTTIINTIAFLTAASASVFLFVSPEVAASFAATTGIISIFYFDYGRTFEPVRIPAGIVPFDLALQSPAEAKKAA